MGKHVRVGGKGAGKARAVAGTQPERGPLHDRFEDALHRELDHLNDLRATLATAIAAGDVTPAIVRESAGVSRVLAQLSAEVRQRQKHEKRMTEGMTPEETDELVHQYIRELAPQRRKTFRDLIDELDAEEKVLAG